MSQSLEDFYEYWLKVYPRIFKEEDSIYESYIKSLLTGIKDDSDNTNLYLDNLALSTLNVDGVRIWENFLGIPLDENLALEYRRAKLQALVNGFPPTVDNIKKTIITLTNGGDVTIHEHGIPTDPLYDPSKPYSVTVVIDLTSIDVLQNFDTNETEAIINRLFPAHTVEIIYDWTFPASFYKKYAPDAASGKYDEYTTVYA